MFIAFTGPLALFLLDILSLGFFRLVFWLLHRTRGTAPARLRQHATITFAGQLALGLLLIALSSGLDLNSLSATKFFAVLIFSSALAIPLALQIRHYGQRRP